MATTLPVVVDVTAKNDGKAAAAFNELNKGVDRFSTAADKMAKSLDQVLARLRQMEASGSKAGQSAAKSLDQAAAQAERAAQRELRARQVVIREASVQLKAEAAARQSGLDAERRAEAEKRAAKKATAQASAQAAQADKAAAAASAKSAQEAVKAAQAQAKASKDAAKAADELRAKVEQSAQAMAVGLGAAALVLGGLTGAVLSTANEFEVLLTRLQTVQGSAAVAQQTFQRSVEFAAKTPFDLKGVVDATVTLEVYGQRSEVILPRVAALAAGMGKSLTDTALVVGKAMSGSLEGFESLRNEYGITTRELQRFGAETLKTGGILTQSAGQAEKARNALTRIIDARFGDALERQSQTTAAAIERVKDEITQLAAEIGAGAAGVVKFAAGPIQGAVNLLRQVPAPLKAIAGGALLVATVVTGVGAAGAIGAAGLLALNTQLVAAAAVMPALTTAAAASTTVVTGLGTAFAFLKTAASAALFTPLGAAIGAVTAAFAAGTIATNSYADAQRLLGQEIKKDSSIFQGRINQFRELNKLSRELANKDRQEQGLAPIPEGRDDSVQRISNIKKALDTASTSEFFSKFKALGLDAEQTKNELGKITQEISASEKILEEQAKARDEREATLRKAAKRGTPQATEERLNTLKATDAEFQRLQGNVNQTAVLINTNKELEAQLKLVEARYVANAKSIESIGQAAKATADFQKQSEKAGDLKSLNAAYGVSVQKLGQMKQALKDLNQPTDKKSLLNELRTLPQDSPLRDVINTYLDQLDQLGDQEKALLEKRAEGPKKEIDALQASLAEKKSLQQASAQDELASLAQQLELAQTLTHGKEAEVTRILGEQKTARARLRKQEADEELAGLKAGLDAAKALPVSVRSTGPAADNKGTLESVAAYDAAIARVQTYLSELNKLRAAGTITAENFKAMGAAGKTALEQLQIARAADDAARLARNLTEFKDEFSNAFAGAESSGPAAQLLVVENAITRAKAAQRDGSIASKAADQELADLGRTRLQLEQTISQEKLRQAGEINQLEQAALQQEIDLLQLRKEQGFAVDAEILAKTEELYAKKLEALQNELDAELVAAQDNADAKLHAEEVFQKKVAELEKGRTIDLEREYTNRASIEAGGTPRATGQSRSNQDSSSAGGGGGISDSASTIGPGATVPVVNGFASGIGSSGFSSRQDYLDKRGEKVSDGSSFDRANPGLLAAQRSQDNARAIALAQAQASQSAAGRKTQAENLADVTARQNAALAALGRFGQPSVPQAIADKANQVTQAGSAPAPKSDPGDKASGVTPVAKGAAGAAGGNTTVNVTVNVDGGNADPDERAIGEAAGRIADKRARQDKLQGRGSAGASAPIGYGTSQQ